MHVTHPYFYTDFIILIERLTLGKVLLLPRSKINIAQI